MLFMEPGELLPRPDPTRLTTEQLFREIEHLQAYLTVRIDSLEAKPLPGGCGYFAHGSACATMRGTGRNRTRIERALVTEEADEQ